MTARTKALSRQERALSWRRDHVLECAERIFSSKGFHQATMQEIAAEAEYATGIGVHRGDLGAMGREDWRIYCRANLFILRYPE